MFIATQITIAKKWKQSKCLSSDKCIMNMWCIDTTEYYSTVNENEVMKFSGNWIELGKVISSEVIYIQKDKCQISHFSPLAPNMQIGVHIQD